jgi:hypothetical protein
MKNKNMRSFKHVREKLQQKQIHGVTRKENYKNVNFYPGPGLEFIYPHFLLQATRLTTKRNTKIHILFKS